MENIDLNAVWENVLSLASEYVPRVLLAIATLLVGFFLIKRLIKLAGRIMKAQEVDETLSKFLGDLLNVLLKAVLLISVASMVGIETTSFVALLGAAGLAVGLALQGSLANFAGGVLILIFRPFNVNDLVEAQGYFGRVSAINIFVTTLITLEEKTVIIPNGPLSNGSITNYSKAGKLRVDLSVGISYRADIKQAREVILAAVEAHDKVMKDPAPTVSLIELGDSSVNLTVRPYAHPDDYWAVYFGLMEDIKVALDEANIEIPFPQRVIHQVAD